MSLAFVLDDVFATHRPPGSHPERPERIVAVRDALRGADLARRGTQLPLRRATDEDLGRVHTAAYLHELERTLPGASGWLDPDTYYSDGTWHAALCAAGAAVDVTRAVLDGQFTRGIAMVRPPGHHAETDRAMGFCIFNNVAAAAAAARAAGAARVAVLDWDVHHGNGTQHIFYDDPSVLYLSCHQYPFYPGTGGPDEVGIGDGRGANVNVGLPAGCGDPEYLAAFDEVLVPAMRRFRPEVVLISAGFDAYAADPLAGMNVSARGFAAMAERMVALADQVCDGRLVAVLEGGYDLGGLASGALALLDAVDRRAGSSAPGVGPGAAETDIADGARLAIERTKRCLSDVGVEL